MSMTKKIVDVEAEDQAEMSGENDQYAVSIMNLGSLANVPQSAAIAKIETMTEILRTVRRAAIKMTRESDWIMYHNQKTGHTIAYLQDAGCQRTRDIFGINITPHGPPELIPGDNPDDFAYVITGDGLSRLTGQALAGVEGCKTSAEIRNNPQFAALTGAALKAQVRKHARANLDGNISRKLAGLSNVPAEVLREAGLNIERCIQGRGFGKSAAKAVSQMTDAVCPECENPMKYIPAGVNKQGKKYNEFWACSQKDCNYRTWENPLKGNSDDDENDS